MALLIFVGGPRDGQVRTAVPTPTYVFPKRYKFDGADTNAFSSAPAIVTNSKMELDTYVLYGKVLTTNTYYYRFKADDTRLKVKFPNEWGEQAP